MCALCSSKTTKIHLRIVNQVFVKNLVSGFLILDSLTMILSFIADFVDFGG